MPHNPLFPVRTILILLSFLLLSGCITMSPDPSVVEGRTPVGDNVFTVVVNAGESGRCRSSPCSVYFRTPAAGRPVEVVANNQTVGNFPPDTVVHLGHFSSTSRILVVGTDTPITFIRIPNSNNR
ncbi:MAG: hypothetical protein GY703_00920 [Gammaproteobacteria bacterium]|nr:hypothetical protein [Gammaproteobacteria bacterium]